MPMKIELNNRAIAAKQGLVCSEDTTRSEDTEPR
jgi:hypothetical protein